jgi:hypothetical protein
MKGPKLLLFIVILLTPLLVSGTSAQSTYRAYLPGVNSPATPTIFGFETILGRLSNPTVRARAAELGATWVRINGLRWDEIEPVQGGGYSAAALELLDRDLKAAGELGLTATVIVHGAPAWAQEIANTRCGPIRSDALDDFANFMRDMVTRYSYPPYNVTHWELGNEPDAPYIGAAGSTTNTMPYGCWGNPNQPDYNGGAYAAMLAAVYPAIKAANPNAQVIIGGLLYGCVPGSDCGNNEQYKSSTFLDGVLSAGGGAYFDIFAYHSYPFWADPNASSNEDWDIAGTGNPWAPHGGLLLGKLSFIRAKLAEYGLQQKPIMMNEGALLCYNSDARCGPDGFEDDKASYVIRLFARSSANGLIGSFYYTLDGRGWQDAGLLDGNQQPRPAFTALKHMISLVGKSQGAATNVTAEYGSASDIEAYRFNHGNDRVDVIWKIRSTATTPISLPASKFISATTSQGSAITPLTVGSTVTLDVGFMPIYIVRQP